MYAKIDDDFFDDGLPSLESILSILDAELLEFYHKVQEALDNLINPHDLGILDYGEYIIGVGFALCHKYMTSTLFTKRINKSDAYEVGPTHENGKTLANIINATANYWKHHDEWDSFSISKE